MESTFATARLNPRRTKGNGSGKACPAMVFKLCQSAQRRRGRLNDSELPKEVIAKVMFTDGIETSAG